MNSMSRFLLYGFSQHNYSTTFSPAGLCFVFLLSFSFIISYAGDQIKKVTVSGKRGRLLLPFGGGGTRLPRKGICKSTTWDLKSMKLLCWNISSNWRNKLEKYHLSYARLPWEQWSWHGLCGRTWILKNWESAFLRCILILLVSFVPQRQWN